MTISPESLVNREVQVCLSYLVSTLAQGYGAAVTHVDANGRRSTNGGDLADMIEQAFELACPIDDWEEAAVQDGWRIAEDGVSLINRDLDRAWPSLAWQDAANDSGTFEPYQREVFEHWAVSQWFGEKLRAKGEKVDFDFAGLVVWARTCTGQGIASDSVVEAICAELNNAQ